MKDEINMKFAPETLEQCRQHYIPPIKKYISCSEFGHPDGMNGSCHWCREMCPYQFEMCGDEDWLRGLLIRDKKMSREEAIKFIENYKQSKEEEIKFDKKRRAVKQS